MRHSLRTLLSAYLTTYVIVSLSQTATAATGDGTPVVSLPHSVAFGRSLQGQQELLERIHERSRSKVNAAVQEQHVAGYESLQMWEYLLPTYSCATEERVGPVFDGGKWLCGKRTLLQDPGCIVASVGADNGTEFEEQLLRSTPCRVYMFDPAPTSAKRRLTEQYPRLRLLERGPAAEGRNASEKATFNSSELELALQDLQRQHGWIDVLKIDAEGAEWGLLDALLESSEPLPFTQIQMELHLWRGTYLWRGGYKDQLGTVQRLQQRGFRIFHRENNGCGKGNVYEVAFIQVDANGTVVGRPTTAASKPRLVPLGELLGADIHAQQQLMEQLYRDSLQNHSQLISGSGRWAADVADNEHMPGCDEPVWEALAAVYNCPLAERVGSLGDGGAWLCSRETLLAGRKCSVYSFGASRNTSFAEAIAGSSSCEVLQSRHIASPPHARASARKHLHNSPRSSALAELPSVMAHHGHSWLEALRVEISTKEELAIFVQVVEESQTFLSTQLQLRINYPGSNEELFRLFATLRSKNMRMFHWEPVMHSTTTAEFAFIQVDASGDVVLGTHQALPLLGHALLKIYWSNLKEWAASHV